MATESQAPAAPGAQPAASADDLLDEYLGASEESTPQDPPRKPAKPGRSEPETPENEDDDSADADDADEEEGEDTADDDDAAADDDDDDQSEDEAGRFVGQNGRVKLADGTVTTVAELIRGNLREADYTRKTQETGALHSELQARLADYSQQNQLVETALRIMAAALPPEPDPALLQPGEGYDPVGYTSQKLLWDRAAGQLQGLMQAHAQSAQRNAEAQGTLLKQYALVQKDVLLQRHPELRHRDKLEAYHSGLVKTLSRRGLGAEDLANVYDARVILAIEELGELDKIKASRHAAKRKAQGAPVLAPSGRQSPQGRKARARGADWETLRKTGSHGSAGEAALDRILDDFVR